MSRVVLPASPDLDDNDDVYRFVSEVRKVEGLDLNVKFRIIDLTNSAHNIQISERILRSVVNTCRRQGLTWAQIGHCLGISHQAAQQRFGRYTDR